MKLLQLSHGERILFNNRNESSAKIVTERVVLFRVRLNLGLLENSYRENSIRRRVKRKLLFMKELKQKITDILNNIEQSIFYELFIMKKIR